MEPAIGTKTDEEAAAWMRVIQLSENKGAARAATAWIKSNDSQGVRVSLQDVLSFLEEYHSPCNYQRYVDSQRERHIHGGYGWPGKAVGDPAVSRHPNIVVELTCSFYWLRTIAEFAHVSEELMAAVIEDDEELCGVELLCFARSWGVPVGYLRAPTLQIVDPATNKGKMRRRYLRDLLKQAAGLAIDKGRGEFVLDVRDALIEGRVIPYAHYRWACFCIEEVLENAMPKPECAVRTKRGSVA